MPEPSHWKPAVLVAALTSCLLWFSVADRLRLNIDEGMYIDGASRAYKGEVLYRDFLAHTGPGTFWLCELAFRLAGVSLSHARIPLVLGLGAMAGGVFYLTASLTARSFAYGVTFLFLAFEMRDLYLIAVNHRWDSGALAFLAIVAGFGALRSNSLPLSFVAGMCAAGSAFVTPTVGLIALPLAAWMIFRGSMRTTVTLICGGVVVTAVCAASLAAQGALAPMIHHFLWTGSNYSGPNRVPYGYAGTGFDEALSGLNPVAKALFSVVLASMLLPSVLPPLTYAGWAAWVAFNRSEDSLRKGEIAFLLICSVALFASTYPRWDNGHLLYVAPIYYVLAATLAYWALPRRLLPPLFAALLALLAFLWWQPLMKEREFASLQTASGRVTVRPEDRALVESISNRVHPGDSLFVFPNFPSVYFLTGGVNPSRFSFLQAGLMTDEDEQSALRDLERKPPHWVVYWDVPIERYLKTSPSADPARLRFNHIEQYLRDNYRWVETHDHWHGPYSILERKGT